MASVNKVILMGNLGRDPEIKYMQSGEAVCNVSIATSSSWKDKQTGERKEEVEWHRLVFYRRLAEIVGEYLRKGSSIYIEGRLKTRSWTDKDGNQRHTTEVTVDQMQMLGNREGSQGSSQQQKPAQGQTQQQNPAPQGAPQTSLADLDDDVPF